MRDNIGAKTFLDRKVFLRTPILVARGWVHEFRSESLTGGSMTVHLGSTGKTNK
jgi:hypothetical protein